MSSIVRLKENEITEEMFALLQNTIYTGLGKTEIIRAILAEKTWEVRNQMAQNNFQPRLDPATKQKIQKAYQSHKNGHSIRVKNQQIEEFLESLTA